MDRKKLLRTLAAVLLLGVFLYSAVRSYTIIDSYRTVEKGYAQLSDTYTQAAPAPTEAPEPAATEPPERAPLTIDFDALQAEYPCMVAWLHAPGSQLNYPLAQGEDNQFYLRHLPNGVWDGHGCLYLDYRCQADFTSWNNIIYGHDMDNGSMFGTLELYYEQEYYDEHPYMYLLTPGQDYKIILLASYITSSTDELTYILPTSQEERDVLIEKAMAGSSFRTEERALDDEKLIALSTCAYDYSGARHVVLGALRPLAPYEEGGG